MIYVIAGNHREAQSWAQSQGLAPRQWRYVYDANSIIGLRRPVVVLTGRHWANENVGEMLRYLQSPAYDAVIIRG